MTYNVDKKYTEGLDPDFYAQIVELFKGYDANGNGVIEKNEFVELLKSLGYEDVEKSEIDALFKDIDLNSDSVISFAEFLVLMKKMTGKKTKKKKNK